MIESLRMIAAGIDIKASDIALPKVLADASNFDKILGIVYITLAAFAIFFIVRGALLYVTHGSDPGTVKQARETILYAAVALVGATLVFTLIQFVVKSVGGY
jgi:hypothetical protein